MDDSNIYHLFNLYCSICADNFKEQQNVLDFLSLLISSLHIMSGDFGSTDIPMNYLSVSFTWIDSYPVWGLFFVFIKSPSFSNGEELINVTGGLG